jgi:hypothetical protein
METAFTTAVHAREETVWKVLLDKVENPGKYVREITGCRILEKYPDGLLREISSGSLTFRERVEVDPDTGEITYTLVDHPYFTGTVVNRAGGTSRQSPVAPTMLTFIMDWSPRGEEGGRILDLAACTSAIRAAANAVKDAAEDLDAEWSGYEEVEQGKEVFPEEYRASQERPVEEQTHRP